MTRSFFINLCRWLFLTAKGQDLCEDIIITEGLALDSRICWGEYSLLDLGVLAIAGEDELSMSGLVGHQVSNRASYDGCRLAVVRDGSKEVLQIG